MIETNDISEKTQIPTIGQEIRRLREIQELTTREVGKALGITHASVSMYETRDDARIPDDKIIQIARILQIDKEYLQFLNLEIPNEYKAYLAQSKIVPAPVHRMLGISPKTKPSSEVVELVKNLFSDIRDAHPDYIAFHSHLIKKIESCQPETQTLLWVNYYQGLLSFTQKNNKEATEILTELYNTLEIKEDIELQTEVALRLGREHHVQGRYQEALKYYNDCEQIFWQQPNYPGLSSVFRALGDIYQKQGNIEEALKYYQKSLEAAGPGPNLFRALTLNAQGLLLRYLGDLEKSLDCLTESLVIFDSLKSDEINIMRLAETQLSLSALYRTRFESKEAVHWVFKARETLQIFDQRETDTASYLHLTGLIDCEEARAYLIAGKVEQAIIIFERTRDFYKRVQVDYPKIAEFVVSIACRHLGQAYSQIGKDEEAINCLHQALGITTIFDPQKVRHNLEASLLLGDVYLKQGAIEEVDCIIEQVKKALSPDNRQHFWSWAYLSCLEVKRAYHHKEWKVGHDKFGEAAIWAVKWHPVLLEQDIQQRIGKQIVLLYQSEPAQATALCDYLISLAQQNWELQGKAPGFLEFVQEKKGEIIQNQ